MSETTRTARGAEGQSGPKVIRVPYGEDHVRVTTLSGPDGRDFVLVAGIGVASDYYVRLALDLNTVGCIHSLDLPGFGGVPHGRKTLSIPDFASLVEAAIDEMGLKDPVLIGHSMGSQVVTEVAARRPELSSIVLIGPVINAAERTIPRQAIRLLQCAGREPMAITLHVLISYVLCGPKWFFRVLPQMMRYRIEDRLPEVQAHTLILRGEHDTTCPRRWARHLAEITPRARAWEIPEAAHSVMYAHAGAVAALSLEHIQHPEREHDDPRFQQITKKVNPDAKRSAKRFLRRVFGNAIALVGMARDKDYLIELGSRHELAGYAGPHDSGDVQAIPLEPERQGDM